MRRTKRNAWGLSLGLSGILLVVFNFSTLAQDDAVFSTGVNVVNLIATVRDEAGRLVNNLGKDDFTLKEDSKEQAIQYFAQQTDLPLTLGLLVDTSMSQRRVLDQEKTASNRFLERVLDESKDQAFVIGFDVDVELLQDLTSSKKLLKAGLGELKTPDRPSRNTPRQNLQFPGGPFPGGRGPRGNPRGGWPGGARGPRGRGTVPQGLGTVLYDAVFLGADDMLQKQAGRKAMVVISDGVDLGSKITLEKAVEAAHRGDAVVYSIYFVDEELQARVSNRAGRGGGMGGRTDGENVLRELSEQTGGQLYKLTKDLTLDEVFDRIEEELRSQYSIGYTPDLSGNSAAFRKIELKTKKSGLKVFTRSGYYPAQEKNQPLAP
jgi:VWFA-related protein